MGQIVITQTAKYLNENFDKEKVLLWDKYNKEVKKEYKHSSQVQGIYLVSKKLITLCENNVSEYFLTNSRFLSGSLSLEKLKESLELAPNISLSA
jgi:hypothetical protein